MLFFIQSMLSRKELKHMKRTLRIISALFAALVFGWYCIPQVYRVLHAPDTVDAGTDLNAPAIASRIQNARFVRESGDERLSAATVGTAEILLFRIVPLRTVSVSAQYRTVNAGGQAVGVILHTEGVQIVGLENIKTSSGEVCPAAEAGLREGDMICALNGQQVTDTECFSLLCRNAGDTCTISYLREGDRFHTSLKPVTDNGGEKRIGAWVRDSTSGIGTLSFYDGKTGAYTALGHGVTDVDTQKLIAPATGFLTEAVIQKIRRSNGVEAGELVGQFSVSRQDAIATVDRNTPFGICGTLTAFHDPAARTVEIAPSGAAHRGDAYILSTVDGSVAPYSVKVIRVDVQSSPGTQGMMIEITDPKLLDRTGGIVQGMSGSPLIQDGRLIGVVTHVFLSRPTRGYCLYAEWMERELMQ